MIGELFVNRIATWQVRKGEPLVKSEKLGMESFISIGLPHGMLGVESILRSH